MFRDVLKNYVRQAGLHCDFGKPGFRVTNDIVRELRPLSYIDQWRVLREKRWFHAALPDHSLFVFKLEACASYMFYDRPIDAMTVEEYIANQGHEVTAHLVQDVSEEYDDYLATADLRKHWTPIRYDHDPGSYRPGVHPAAHIHIGVGNDIRLGLRRELTPAAFFLFVLRQMYPSNWERLLSHLECSVINRRVRNELKHIDSRLLADRDEAEMYLH